MKLRILIVSALALLALPAIGLANPPAQAKADAVRACNAQKAALGEATFKQTYGTNAGRSNAFGKCVLRMTQAAVKAQASATSACQAERADANFSASHSGKTFDQFYGGQGKADKNAFGKCISMKAQAQIAQVVTAYKNAAKACKAERTSVGETAFKNKYGTNANKSNAFGKCVAKLASA
jgi:hypothetical protein